MLRLMLGAHFSRCFDCLMGVRIRGSLVGDIDPLNKVPFKRATSRVKKGPLLRGLSNTT